MNLGQFFLQLNRAELAAPQFAAAVRLSPALAAPRVWLAASLQQMGQPASGLEILEGARGLDGSSRMAGRSWTIRGDLLTSLNRPAEAVEAYGHALRDLSTPEQEPAVLASRALARLQAGDAEGAAADIGTSLDQAPNNLQAYWILGRCEEARGRKDAAVRAYERFRAMGGKSAEVDAALSRLGGTR
jgi:tetratricopeptide (TPR) repeat protein